MTEAEGSHDRRRYEALLIRSAREAKGLSLRTVGRMIGVSRTTVSRWEAGAISPTTVLLVRLGQILDTPLVSGNSGRVVLGDVQLGALLRALRSRAGVTQGEAAAMFACSKPAISRWEAGERAAGREVARLYAEAFGAIPAEALALQTGEMDNPLIRPSVVSLTDWIEEMRTRRLQEGEFGSTWSSSPRKRH